MLARTFLLAALLFSFALLTGCAKKPEKTAPPPPEVGVASPVTKYVTEIEEFTGWTKAVKTVEIRARVTGYLDQVSFEDGKNVTKGDELFLIDPRTYKAEADKAEATVKQSEATLERLTSDLRRGRTLATGRAISSEELDKLSGNRNEADAAVRVAKAMLESARLNVGFTKVTAPIDGRLSRRMVDPGNLVKADDTVLTTIVSLDPIHAYFDIDERTVLSLRRMIQNKEIESARKTPIKVKIGLADKEDFGLEGKVDFVDNALDHGTGTLRVRATVPNPAKNDVHTLSPGMFVRVQLPVGVAQQSLLIPEAALGSDQGNKFVYLLDADNKVVQKRVVVGQQDGTMRVIKSGVGPKDREDVTGQQRVRPGVQVTVKEPKANGERAAAH